MFRLGILAALLAGVVCEEECVAKLPDLTLEGSWMKGFMVCDTPSGDDSYWDVQFEAR